MAWLKRTRRRENPCNRIYTYIGRVFKNVKDKNNSKVKGNKINHEGYWFHYEFIENLQGSGKVFTADTGWKK